MTTTYRVTYSRGQASREIGRYDTLHEAVAAARSAGAVGTGQKSGRDFLYAVVGHEGDDDYGIWIEWPQTYEWK